MALMFVPLRRMFVRNVPLDLTGDDTVDHAFSIMPAQAASGTDFLVRLKIIETLTTGLMESTPTAGGLNTAVVLTFLVQLRLHFLERYLDLLQAIFRLQLDGFLCLWRFLLLLFLFWRLTGAKAQDNDKAQEEMDLFSNHHSSSPSFAYLNTQ
ncbi:MAG: hypothetical protein ACE5JI_18670 [Acidobacteriota bacterium]